MEKFVIEGGIPLRGEVTPSGNKNAALPILAACLLTDEPVTIHNMPRIKDVLDMRTLLESLGVQTETLNGGPGVSPPRMSALPTSIRTCAGASALRSFSPGR